MPAERSFNAGNSRPDNQLSPLKTRIKTRVRIVELREFFHTEYKYAISLNPLNTVFLWSVLVFSASFSAWSLPLPFPYAYQMVSEAEIESLSNRYALNKVHHLQEGLLQWPKHSFIRTSSFSHLLNSLEIKLIDHSDRPADKHTVQVLLTAEHLIDSAYQGLMQSIDDQGSRDKWLQITMWLTLTTALNRFELMWQDRLLTPEISGVFDRVQRAGIIPSLSDVIPSGIQSNLIQPGQQTVITSENESVPPHSSVTMHATDDSANQLKLTKKRLSDLEADLKKLNEQAEKSTPPNNPESSLNSRENRLVMRSKRIQLNKDCRETQLELSKLQHSCQDLEQNRHQMQAKSDNLSSQLQDKIEKLTAIQTDIQSHPDPDTTDITARTASYFKKWPPTSPSENTEHLTPEQQLIRLEQESKKLIDEKTSLNIKIDALKEQDRSLQREQSELEIAITDLTDKLSTSDTQKNQLKSQQQDIEDKIQTSENNLKESLFGIDSIQKSRAPLEKQIPELVQQQHQLIQTAIELENKRQIHLHKMEAIETTYSKPDSPPQGTAARLQAYTQEENAVREFSNIILNEYKLPIDSLSEQLQGIDVQLTKLQQRYQSLTQQHSAEATHLESLESQLHKIRDEVAAVDKKSLLSTQCLDDLKKIENDYASQSRKVREKKSQRLSQHEQMLKKINENSCLFNDCISIVNARQRREQLIGQQRQQLSEKDQVSQYYDETFDNLQGTERQLNEAQQQCAALERRLGQLTSERDNLPTDIGSRSASPDFLSPQYSPPKTASPSLDLLLKIDEQEQEVASVQRELHKMQQRLNDNFEGIENIESIAGIEPTSAPPIIDAQPPSPIEEPGLLFNTVRCLSGYAQWIPHLTHWILKGSTALSGALVYYYEEKSSYSFLKALSDEENALQLLLNLDRKENLTVTQYPSDTDHRDKKKHPIAVYYDIEAHGQSPIRSEKPSICQGLCLKPDPAQVLINLSKPSQMMGVSHHDFEEVTSKHGKTGVKQKLRKQKKHLIPWSPYDYRVTKEDMSVCLPSERPLDISEPEVITHEPNNSIPQVSENAITPEITPEIQQEIETLDENSTAQITDIDFDDTVTPPLEIPQETVDYTRDKSAIIAWLQSTEVMPEFDSLSSINSLSSILLIDTFSALRNAGGLVWQNYQQQRSASGFFPETLAFSQGNSQFVRHEPSLPFYTFINGSQQTGDYYSGTWGGSSFSWGALGFVKKYVMAGVILAEQKINFIDSISNATIRSQGQSCYSLISFQVGDFNIMTIAGIGWPDFRYHREETNDRFSATQWSGYAAISRKIPLNILTLDTTLSPSFEILKSSSSSYGHSSYDGSYKIMTLEQNLAEISMIKTGFTLDFQYGPTNYQQTWQIYLGWQRSHGNQAMTYTLAGASEHHQSATPPSRNTLLNISASQSLSKNVILQLTINNSWGDEGNHQGININYTQLF